MLYIALVSLLQHTINILKIYIICSPSSIERRSLFKKYRYPL